MESIVYPYLTAITFSLVFMTIMWSWGKARDNYAVIDVGWGLVIAGIGTVLSFFGSGNLYAKLSVLLPTWFWALRLSLFLYWTRIRTNHPEDKRYAGFRSDYGDKVHQKMFTNVFLLQAVLALMLSLPFWVASQWTFFPNQGLFGPHGSLFVWIGWALVAVGIFGETKADQDLHRFVSNPNNKGLVCNLGLWKYTRHPNYFFEWVIWLGISTIPIAYGGSAYLSFFSALMMFVLLRFISGVPFAEKYSLLSKGDRFREYQRTTNAFFPWFPKINTNQSKG